MSEAGEERGGGVRGWRREKKEARPSRPLFSFLFPPLSLVSLSLLSKGGQQKNPLSIYRTRLTEGHLRDPVPRHPRLVEEDPPEMVPVGENLCLPRQVRASRVDDVEAGVDPEGSGDLLQPQVLFHRDGVVGAALDGGVVGRDGDELTGDAAEAGDDAAAGDGIGGCWFFFFFERERERGREVNEIRGFLRPSSSAIDRRICVLLLFHLSLSLSLFLSLSLSLRPCSSAHLLTVQPVSSESRQLQERRSRVKHCVYALPREPLPPRPMAPHGLCPAALRRLSLEPPHLADELRHSPGVGFEARGARVGAVGPQSRGGVGERQRGVERCRERREEGTRRGGEERGERERRCCCCY